MRPREIILKDGTRTDTLILEVLLDIRDSIGEVKPKVKEAPLPATEARKGTRRKKRKYTRKVKD